MEVAIQNNSRDFTNHKNLKMHSFITEIKMHGATQGSMFFNAILIVPLFFPISVRITVSDQVAMTPCSVKKKKKKKNTLLNQILFFVVSNLLSFIFLGKKRSRISTPVNKCFLIVNILKASF